MRKRNLIVVPIAALALTGLTAFAAILATDGTAKVTGQVGHLSPVVNVDNGNVFDSALWPGHSTGCTVVVHNPNSVDVLVTKLHPSGVVVTNPSGGLVFQGDPTVSPVSDFATFPDLTPTNFVVGAGQDGSYHLTSCVSVVNHDDSAEAGDGAAVHYAVSYQSN